MIITNPRKYDYNLHGDEVISNEIFVCDLFMIDENRKFGPKGKGRKKHKVGMEQRLFPDKHHYEDIFMHEILHTWIDKEIILIIITIK